MSKKNKSQTIIIWAVIILTMISIYQLSNQPATESRALSAPFAAVFKEIVKRLPFLSEGKKGFLIASAVFYVRKLAHFVIYTLLGGTLFIGFYSSLLKKRKAILLALIMSVGYAITDEWHQHYITGRGPQVTDIYLDSMGALSGILLAVCCLSIWHALRNRRRQLHKHDENHPYYEKKGD